MRVDTTIFHTYWNSTQEKKMDLDEESKGNAVIDLDDVGFQREFANYDHI